MALRIKLKNSVVQDRIPTTSDLPAVGELAVNANINSIGGFMRASDNTIVKIFGPGSLSTPAASDTVAGISELATNAETTGGTATDKVVTPAGLNAVTVAERSTSNSTYLALTGGSLSGGLTVSGTVAATALSGDGSALTSIAANALTGTIQDARFPATLPTASGENLTSIPAGELTGTVADARITSLTASKLTGALPAIDGSALTNLPAGGLSNIVDDTTPQLGGNLDVQGNEINTSTTDANIILNPNGAGVVEIKGDGTSNGNVGTLQLNCSNNNHGVKIKSPPHSAGASYTLTLPNTDGNANQVLKTDGSGGLDWVDQASGGLSSDSRFNVLGGTDAGGNLNLSHSTSFYAGYNVFIGHEVAKNAVTTYSNTVIGYQAFYTEQSNGNSNTAVGRKTLYTNNGGSFSAAFGSQALENSTGNKNCAFGYLAGNNITSGINNICIGASVNASSATVSNEVTIGDSNITKFRIPGLDGFEIDDNGTIDLGGAINENVFAITDASSVALDPDNGMVQTWTLGANRTATDSLTSGQSMLLIVTATTNNYTLTWPSMKWNGGSAPTLGGTDPVAIELFKVGGQLYGANIGELS